MRQNRRRLESFRRKNDLVKFGLAPPQVRSVGEPGSRAGFDFDG
jgi:hypothetical protein